MWLSIGVLHPVVGHGAITAELVRIATPLAIVHGMVIVAVIALLFGVAALSLRRGLTSSVVLAALVVFAIATLAVTGAAMIDGFLGPSVASYRVHQPSEVAAIFDLLKLLSDAIQVFTKMGLIGFTLAIALWSIDFLREAGPVRNAGILGLAVGAGTIVLLLATPYIGAHALIGLGFLQGCWYATIASLLYTDRL